MKVRALKNCLVPDAQGRNTYRRGPEYDVFDNLVEGGEVFDIPDSYVVNLGVLEIVEPPANGKPRTLRPRDPTPAPPAGAPA